MDSLVAVLTDISYYIVDAWDWLLLLSPDQYFRVFWAVIFLELPRYAAANVYVLFLFFAGRFDRTSTEVSPSTAPLVSIIVPSYNEGHIISQTVSSLLEQNYPNIEIVVVDDGSTDDTPARTEELRRQANVSAFRLVERQGKSAALNFGLSVSRGQFIVFLDADSTLDRDVVSNLMVHFDDPNVGAVSGDLGVRNHHVNLLTRFQAVEYLISLSLGRRFKATMGILSIVPGAIGAFRRDLLTRIGGIDPGPGNDSCVTIRTRKLGMQIAFAGGATCLTTAPVTWRHWYKQRMRWERNIVRNRARKHVDIFNPKQASFTLSNFISFLDTFFFVAILPVLWLIYMVDMITTYPDEYGYILIAVVILHFGLNFLRALMGLIITDRAIDISDICIALPMYSYYRLLLKSVRIVAIAQELLFRSSYRDPFAPEKVRENMKIY